MFATNSLDSLPSELIVDEIIQSRASQRRRRTGETSTSRICDDTENGDSAIKKQEKSEAAVDLITNRTASVDESTVDLRTALSVTVGEGSWVRFVQLLFADAAALLPVASTQSTPGIDELQSIASRRPPRASSSGVHLIVSSLQSKQSSSAGAFLSSANPHIV